MNRIEEEIIASVLLEEVMKSEVAADMVASKIRQRLEVNGYGKLPQPLDDKELDKAIAEVLRKNMGVRVADTIHGKEREFFFPDMVTEFRALLQPKIEEAKREEREKVMLLADELSACILILQEELDKRQITLPKFWSGPIDARFIEKTIEKAKEWQALKGGE